MNNDISRDLHKHIISSNQHANNKSVSASVSKNQVGEAQAQNNYLNTQNFLSMLGRTKVNMDKTSVNNRVASYVEAFKNDSQYSQNYVEFCDGLLEKGYSLEDAIIGTDIIFKGLKQESTYKL